jgi:hypothetical protein
MTKTRSTILFIIVAAAGVALLRDALLARQASQPAVWREPTGKRIALYHAKGVQIYTLQKGADGKLAWKFKEPQATLFDDGGKAVGTHYAGPTWEASDGSKIVGTKLCERPSPNAASVPELQLEVKSHGGAGVFDAVSLVERLNTSGGMPPGLDPNDKEGASANVPYTADYAFYSKD